MADHPSHRHGVVLWILLWLFAFRVAAQVGAIFVRSPRLPEFEA
jgi:hypothetical protein